MKKRNYIVPSVAVVALLSSHQLLTASEEYHGDLGARELDSPFFDEPTAPDDFPSVILGF